jgi:hypothetical protein
MLERTIWASEGTTFHLSLVPNPDAKTEEQILGDAGFLRYEVTGPRDERHLMDLRPVPRARRRRARRCSYLDTRPSRVRRVGEPGHRPPLTDDNAAA